MNTIEQLAAEQGFDFMGTCSAKELVARPEVRAMCSANKCQVYGHSWACPPACGEIEDFEQQMHEFEHCLVVQTVTEMEDDFDVEAIEEGGELQKRRVLDLVEAIDQAGLSAETMTLSAGTCTLCKECTYPDERAVSRTSASSRWRLPGWSSRKSACKQASRITTARKP